MSYAVLFAALIFGAGNAGATPIFYQGMSEEMAVSLGGFDGVSRVNKYGRNADIDTGSVPEDVWAGGGTYTGVPAGVVGTISETIECFSDNSNDTSAGSGARTLTIYGLDNTGAEFEETISLNGTTAVDVGGGTKYRAFRGRVATSGSATTNNTGTITCRHKTTTANVFFTIPPGTGSTQIGCYTIPLAKTGYLTRFVARMERSNSATVQGALWIREYQGAPRLVRDFFVSQTAQSKFEPYGGIDLPALTDICVRITSVSANNVELVTAFDIVLVANGS